MERLQAGDIMSRDVIRVNLEAPLSDVVHRLIDYDADIVVVVEGADIVGVVTEGDLLHRPETDTDREPAWWLALLSDSVTLAERYVKTHGRRAGDVMTRPAITVTAETPLSVVANTLESNGIRQVPVTAQGRLVGIVSRRDIVRTLADRFARRAPTCDDAAIDAMLQRRLAAAAWAHTSLQRAVVHDGIVDLAGWVKSPSERRALQIIAETVPGVRAVRDHLCDLAVVNRVD